MNTLAKLVGFVAGISGVFFAAFLIGTAVGPVGEGAPTAHDHVQVAEP